MLHPTLTLPGPSVPIHRRATCSGWRRRPAARRRSCTGSEPASLSAPSASSCAVRRLSAQKNLLFRANAANGWRDTGRIDHAILQLRGRHVPRRRHHRLVRSSRARAPCHCMRILNRVLLRTPRSGKSAVATTLRSRPNWPSPSRSPTSSTSSSRRAGRLARLQRHHPPRPLQLQLRLRLRYRPPHSLLPCTFAVQHHTTTYTGGPDPWSARKTAS